MYFITESRTNEFYEKQINAAQNVSVTQNSASKLYFKKFFLPSILCSHETIMLKAKRKHRQIVKPSVKPNANLSRCRDLWSVRNKVTDSSGAIRPATQWES